ncbi:MAG: phosphotransferase enzyme family protein [Bacteroidales bacterium]
MTNLSNIVSQFITEGKILSVQPFGSGHINDSYLVTTDPPATSDYVLQRINHHIFTNVPDLTLNILKVTSHLRNKLRSNHPGSANFEIIRLIPANTNLYYYQDSEGNYWRLYDYIRESRSFDKVETTGQAYEGGKAYGTFQLLACDFDASSLVEILPGFHNISNRLATFRDTVGRDPAERVKGLEDEIRFVEERSEEMHKIFNLGQQGEIPLRVTHNDTKFNNVLFNPSNRAISVVDLDTVMPGFVLYDFGDAIRTGANTGNEDEEELSLVNIDLNLFSAYSKGYLEVASDFLHPVEKELLAFSAKFMTYIIGLRFLTDHLDGDHYYKIKFPGHNLQRARAQFKLLKSMEEQFGEMQDIIRNSH